VLTHTFQLPILANAPTCTSVLSSAMHLGMVMVAMVMVMVMVMVAMVMAVVMMVMMMINKISTNNNKD
jgi:hypothetical protein